MTNDATGAPARANPKTSTRIAIEDAGQAVGRTPEMMSIALNVIAGYASTQRRLAMMLSGRDVDEQFQDDVMHAVEILSITIGGLADELSGNNIHGNSHRWHFGPTFEQAPRGAA